MIKNLINNVCESTPVMVVRESIEMMVEKIEDHFDKDDTTEEELTWDNMSYEERLEHIHNVCGM